MEPMTLGSPIGSPGNNQNQYLPPFLMGDPQAMTPHNNTLSPNQGRFNVSFASSPNGNSPQDISFTSQQLQIQQQQLQQQLNRSTVGTRTLFAGGTGVNSSHQTGPPTQGLFDSLRNEQMHGSPQHRHQLSMLQSPSYSLNQSCHPPTTQLNDSFTSTAPNAINASMRALYSPMGANISPLSISRSSHARGSDFWVTIFGFSPGASSMILHHFAICGTIVDVVHAPQDGNWMHVRFASRIESDKALNYNLKIIASNVMVGVTRCTDESIIDKENSRIGIGSALGAENGKNGEPYRPRVRPLVQQSYNMAQKDILVSPKNNAPQKSTGLVNKAIDLIFGR